MSNHKRVNFFSKKKVALLLVAAITLVNVQLTYASTLSDAKNKKQEAESKLNAASEEIDAIENQTSALQNEINETDQELVNLLVNIGILEDELTAKNVELEQVTSDLAVAQETEASQYASMKKRIQFMYEKGDTAMFEALIASKDFADFLNRVEYVSGVYTYDRNLLEDFKITVQQVSELKVSVEQEKASLEEMQSEYASQQSSLESILANKKSTLGNYEEQLAQAQVKANTYKATIQAQNDVIKAEEEKVAKAEAAAKAAREAAAKDAASTSNNNASTTTSNGSSTPNSSSSNTNSSTSSNTTGSSSGSGSSVVAYATKFVGNPYVWGGTSLTNGADCSGFVMSVFAQFGVSLPHSSSALQGVGTGVSYADAQPGDLICYSGHVAIYMGGGRIVHAANAALGITTGSATYRTILAVRRVV